ncbi:rhodanese-like domain-containing protein [Geotalea toluenoxydans]|uniref:rhodanese-like domain-containing protein n=1 Tax=Geotalea toluenoxydans TaxID=421624 RepID=UPI0006D28A63|nr:rhodanese-like domain-containing protein [Geotalea toluenoxydans]
MVNGKSGIFVCLSLFFMLLAMPVLAVAAGWQWITPQRVTALVKEGSGLWLVDVRSEAAFAAGHIEGAVHIPAALFATKHLPQEKIIVLVDDSLGVRKGRECADALLKKAAPGCSCLPAVWWPGKVKDIQWSEKKGAGFSVVSCPRISSGSGQSHYVEDL